MNVLVISRAYPRDNAPFLGIWAHQSLCQLKEQGDLTASVVSDVPWVPKIAGRLHPKLKRHAELPTYRERDGVPIYYPKCLKLKEYSGPENLWFRVAPHFEWHTLKKQFAKLDMQAFDVVQAHCLYPGGYLAMKLKERYGIPYVVSIHSFGKYNLPQPFNEKLSRQIFKNASAVVAVSEKIRERIAPYVEEKSKLHLVYNSYESHGMDEVAAASESQEQMQTQTQMSASAELVSERSAIDFVKCEGRRSFRILAVGSLLPQKGQHHVLRAAKKLIAERPDMEITVVLVGSGPHESYLRELTAELGISDHVIFRGALDHVEVMREMSACDVFALPSRPEALGVVYLEAMSLQKPIIACRTEGISELVQDGVNGLLVEPNHEGDVFRALAKLLDDPALRARIGAAGQQTALTNCSPAVHAQQLLALYRQAALEKA